MKQKTPSKILTFVLPLVLISALTVAVLVLIDCMTADAVATSAAAGAAEEPTCGPGEFCLDFGDFSPVSMDDQQVPPGARAVTGPGAPAFGALVYNPDFKAIEKAAREKLKRGLDARVALSPYQGNVEFDTYVKKFDYEAGWDVEYTGLDPYGDTLRLIDLIDRVDQDLRDARDLYAYLAVYAPEHRFRADKTYTQTVHPEYSDYWGASQTLCGDPEDPVPEDPDSSGEVLPPVVDWCDFRARLRQSVREAANLRMLFGQQFMVDAMGLHFSGVEFYGGEDAVRAEVAQLRAAKHQYELAEQGLAEALDRAVGSGCYVSDFYKQPEWSLLSRAVENQETAQHHIATRLSYLDVDSPGGLPQVQAVAQDAFRQASIEGYVNLIGIAGQTTSGPLCSVGERPDGQLAADMALNLLETRRKSREMADGRNVFGFDVTFTPARPYKSSEAMDCDTTSPGDRGLWDEAWCAAEYAKELQNDEVDNTRAFDDSQEDLLDEIDEIREGIDARITTVSGCSKAPGDTDEAWFECAEDQIQNLEKCFEEVDDPVQPIDSEFDKCINGDDGYPEIKSGEAKQALLDLRSVYVGYLGIQKQAENINDRVQLSADANAIVTKWLLISGIGETVARVAQAGLQAASCFKPVPSNDPGGAATGAAISGACAATGAANLVSQLVAGALSTAADVKIEDAEYHKEVRNLLLDMSELLIDAYAANQQFRSKDDQFVSLLDGLRGDLVEAQRQRAYFENSPANDPSFRMVRDSSRMVLAKQMAYASRMAYLAARRAEYEYAARLSASNFRISDIYRSRTADDIKRFLTTLLGLTNSLAGSASYETDAMEFRISIALHERLYTDAWLEKEYDITDPAEAQAKRVELFRQWVADHSVPNDFEDPKDGKPVLRFNLTDSLLEGGLFSQVIQQGYEGFWLLKLSGIGEPKISSNGVSVNLLTDESDMSYRMIRMSQGGMVHLRSQAGCTFDYKLMAPAALLGLEWASNQDPEAATATLRANVNDAHDYTENGFRTSRFLGRSVSSTDWEVLIFSGAPEAGLADMDLQQLTDIELIFSATYASREPGEPELSDCTRIDW